MHWKDIIQNQLSENAGKNIFSSRKENNFSFSSDLEEWLKSGEILQLDSEKAEHLIDELVNLVLEKFYQVNQFYQFDHTARCQLKLIYLHLLRECRSLAEGEITSNYSETLPVFANHYLRLQEWLKQHQPFAKTLNPPNIFQAAKVVCAEYQALIQLQALALDPLELKYPVLDLGCGREAYLVNFLQQYNPAVYGLDRITPAQNKFTQSDWLEYDFVPDTWGTIISHLGFSNHFLHHHYRLDGNYLAYARKFMDILKSLISGGTFIYTPALDFIESYLDPSQYMIQNGKVPEVDYNWTRINKL